MFNCSPALKIINGLNNFNTSKVTNMSFMFGNDETDTSMSFTELDLSSFDFRNVTTIAHMFENCTLLTTLGSKPIELIGVTDLTYAFKGCRLLYTRIATNTMPQLYDNIFTDTNGLIELIVSDTNPLIYNKWKEIANLYEHVILINAYRLLDFLSGGKGIALGKVSDQTGLDDAFETIFRNDLYLEIDNEGFIEKSEEDRYIENMILNGINFQYWDVTTEHSWV
jgi:surface protein